MIPAVLRDFISDERALREAWRYTNVAEYAAAPAQVAPVQETIIDKDTLVIDDAAGQGDINLQRQRFIVKAGVTLRHLRVTQYAETQAAFLQTNVAVEAGGAYEFFTLTNGAHRLRQEVNVELVGEQATARIGCAYVLAGKTHHDFTVLINHKAPNCQSHQHIKGVVRDTSRAAFSGKIFVDAIAQNTDAYQLHKALLLSDRAEVDAKPELEIYADQVKCSHGNAMGDLDTNAMFLLRQRGIPEDEARHMLVQAFVADALDYAPAEQRAMLEERLAGLL